MRKVFPVIMLLYLAALAHGRPVIYSVQTNVRASLTFPASEGIKSLEYLAGDELIKVALQTDDGTVTFDITPNMMSDGNALLVANRPPNRDMSDAGPPAFDCLIINGVETVVRDNMVIPYQPDELRLEVSDASGIRAGALQVFANGKRIRSGDVRFSRHGMGRHWVVSYIRPQDFALESLRIEATDSSLLANTSQFMLAVERGFTILSGEQYSGGKAVQFDTESAFIAARLDLPAGKYLLELIAQGTSSGTDSFWMELDGVQQSDPVHIPIDNLGIASSLVEKDPTQLPQFTVTSSGRHILAIVMREGPPQVADRLRILQDGKEIAVFEAEEILPAFPKP